MYYFVKKYDIIKLQGDDCMNKRHNKLRKMTSLIGLKSDVKAVPPEPLFKNKDDRDSDEKLDKNKQES